MLLPTMMKTLPSFPWLLGISPRGELFDSSRERSIVSVLVLPYNMVESWYLVS